MFHLNCKTSGRDALGGFGKARETSQRGIYKVVIRAWHEEASRVALETGRELILASVEISPL